jgi:hypothetical protein
MAVTIINNVDLNATESGARCELCQNFHLTAQFQADQGECRLNPAMNVLANPGAANPVVIVSHAITFNTNWCSHFKPK